MIKILIADQSYLLRIGFGSLIQQLGDVDTVEGVDNDKDFLRSVEKLRPDIILLNTSFFTSLVEADVLGDKNLNEVSILHVSNSILPNGSPDTHLSIMEPKSQLTSKIVTAINTAKQKESSSEDQEEISPREKLILKHVALGLTNKEIANTLFISSHTVISHRKNITRKLGIKTVSGLTVYAILNNIIHMNDIK